MDPETKGMWMWPHIFTHDHDNGEKMAIILLDTQGTFDLESQNKDFFTVFALSTMVSSIQCYNVMHNIGADDLKNLRDFTQTGKFALEESTEKPFQKLFFILRDWPNHKIFDYGLDGGQREVDRILSEKPDRDIDLTNAIKSINSTFDEINGTLLPSPGEEVGTGEFNGSISQISRKFLKYVKEMTPALLAPENLQAKKIYGKAVLAPEFVTNFKSYLDVLKEVEFKSLNEVCLMYMPNMFERFFGDFRFEFH